MGKVEPLYAFFFLNCSLENSKIEPSYLEFLKLANHTN